MERYQVHKILVLANLYIYKYIYIKIFFCSKFVTLLYKKYTKMTQMTQCHTNSMIILKILYCSKSRKSRKSRTIYIIYKYFLCFSNLCFSNLLYIFYKIFSHTIIYALFALFALK